MAETLDDVIARVSSGPSQVSGDAGSVQQHRIPELIEAAKYLASRAAIARGPRLRISKLVPTGIE